MSIENLNVLCYSRATYELQNYIRTCRLLAGKKDMVVDTPMPDETSCFEDRFKVPADPEWIDGQPGCMPQLMPEKDFAASIASAIVPLKNLSKVGVMASPEGGENHVCMITFLARCGDSLQSLSASSKEYWMSA